MISVHRGASRTDRESQALLGLSTHTSDLSRDQKASTAPPKPQKCKESSAPSYTVISTPYGTAIHVFLTYSNALSFSGTVLRAACLAAELFRRPSQHESPKGDGATGSNTGRSTFVLRQIQTFLEYSWTYLGTSARDGIPLFRHTRLSRSNPRDLLAVRSTHPVRRASPTASHNHLGAGTVLSRWSTIYKHTSLVITVS